MVYEVDEVKERRIKFSQETKSHDGNPKINMLAPSVFSRVQTKTRTVWDGSGMRPGDQRSSVQWQTKPLARADQHSVAASPAASGNVAHAAVGKERRGQLAPQLTFTSPTISNVSMRSDRTSVVPSDRDASVTSPVHNQVVNNASSLESSNQSSARDVTMQSANKMADAEVLRRLRELDLQRTLNTILRKGSRLAPGADDVTYVRIDETRAGLDARNGEAMTQTTTTETAYTAQDMPTNIRDQMEDGHVTIPLEKAKKQTVLVSRQAGAHDAVDALTHATHDDVRAFKPLSAPMTSAVIASYKRRPTDGRLTDIDLHVQYHFDNDEHDAKAAEDKARLGQGRSVASPRPIMRVLMTEPSADVSMTSAHDPQHRRSTTRSEEREMTPYTGECMKHM